MFQDILNSTTHRRSSLPSGPWVMMQKWEEITFFHWPVSPNIINRFLPPGLELDTYEGDAWISIVPFNVTDVRFRGIRASVPHVKKFREVNVRTYVRCNGLSGVFFFSLDADNLMAVLGSRVATLSYFYAEMGINRSDGVIYYYCARKQRMPAVFRAMARPVGEFFSPEEGGLSEWLVERYFLWTSIKGILFRGSIHHPKWELQHAQANVTEETLAPFQVRCGRKAPLVHYAASQTTLIWMIRKEH
ncbi:YqjF family protein [Lentibacillus amyloliquefaciens]|uniref:DUF2071 domain-containing protein n=1 Tax=Lentibacillus amyloliquefaciens TaxID=1472767 RepID=A0A0U4G6Y7_9BACI|nr:DUF2071 domain-containing protein [Lentibacillus amyloliquefaciens]ALX48442.1 hypothetical protein AOX59_07365 [Lentibacillus amyloliquefaciens]